MKLLKIIAFAYSFSMAFVLIPHAYFDLTAPDTAQKIILAYMFSMALLIAFISGNAVSKVTKG